MKRILFTGLTTIATLTMTAIPSVSQAGSVTYNPNTIKEESIRQVNPSSIVTMAQRGRLETQYISTGIQLTSDYVLGEIDAEEIVRAGIAANLLTKETIDNSSYLSAVASQLQIHLLQH